MKTIKRLVLSFTLSVSLFLCCSFAMAQSTRKMSVLNKSKDSAFLPVPKKTLNVVLGLPVAPLFNMRTHGAAYTSVGVIGFSIGLEYFYKDNHYISGEIGAATDGFNNQHKYRSGTDYQTGAAVFGSIKNNNMLGRWDIGYGLNMTQFQWSLSPGNGSATVYQEFVNTSVGASLSAQYRLNKAFRLGLLYQPTILNTHDWDPKYNYQHLLTLELVWKMPVTKFK
jgi:hypothetical protein